MDFRTMRNIESLLMSESAGDETDDQSLLCSVYVDSLLNECSRTRMHRKEKRHVAAFTQKWLFVGE